MSKFSHFTKRTNVRSTVSRTNRRDVKPHTLRFGVSAMVAIMVIAYVVQVNAIATKGYRIQELQDTINDLHREHDALQAETTRLQSMAAVKDRVGSLEMVNANEADYVTPTPVAFAR